jgi:hypothetical protein
VTESPAAAVLRWWIQVPPTALCAPGSPASSFSGSNPACGSSSFPPSPMLAVASWWLEARGVAVLLVH